MKALVWIFAVNSNLPKDRYSNQASRTHLLHSTYDWLQRVTTIIGEKQNSDPTHGPTTEINVADPQPTKGDSWLGIFNRPVGRTGLKLSCDGRIMVRRQLAVDNSYPCDARLTKEQEFNFPSFTNSTADTWPTSIARLTWMDSPQATLTPIAPAQTSHRRRNYTIPVTEKLTIKQFKHNCPWNSLASPLSTLRLRS